MNPIRALTEALADRIHATHDAHATARGLTVQKLPWGHRAVRDPRLADYCERRRRRVLTTGGDPLDRWLIRHDPATAAALHATATRLATATTTAGRAA